MCGRMACNLCKEEYRSACSYLESTSNAYVKPEWNDLNNAGFSFHPSNNTCPSDVTPVLISNSKTQSNESCLTSRSIVPMLWGLIPRWHKGEAKKHGLSTTNCRLEGIQNLDSKGGSKLYAPPLREGRRCIVLCEGYYEWQTTKDTKNKQPYYIYAKQESDIKVEEIESWKNASWSEERGWQGPSLLKMAAVYDIWKDGSGEEIYNYSIITMESNRTLSWLHHRVPAILSSEEMVQDWLDTERVSSSRAVSMLNPVCALSWHPVSTSVNNSRFKGSNCNQPLKPAKPSPSTSPLKNWLLTGSMRKRDISPESCASGSAESKKSKTTET